MRILMLGNSLTSANNLPRKLAELTGGEVVSHTRGGARLSEHRNPDTKLGERTAPKSFFSSVENLCRQIREQGAVPILYATWAYQKNGAKLRAKGWDYDEMARKLSEAYHKAARENGALLADVGRRFYELSQTQDLYADDGIHPNERGSRLAAQTIAASIQERKENLL